MNGQGKGGAATVLPFGEREYPAGRRYHYASSDSQALALVLRAAVGRPLAQYLSEKIWRPMGAESDALWVHDGGGYEVGYCCLYATLRDYGRFGMLLANGGALDGRQIIPAQWVEDATSVRFTGLRHARGRYNYGYQTWLLADSERFALHGVRGQAIFIDPKSRTVVVHTAVQRGRGDDNALEAQRDYFNDVLRKLASGS
jgi:CubicO group peptidase (beta-lactamase class C family)